MVCVRSSRNVWDGEEITRCFVMHYSGTSLLRTTRNKDTSISRTLPVVPAI